MARKKESTRRLGWKEFLLSLFLIIALWIAREYLGIEIAPSSGPASEPEGAVKVCFTTPRYPDDASYHHGGLDAMLVSAMDEAQKQIDVAAFELDLKTVAEAMIRAHERGVQVRLVTDTDYADEEAAEMVRRAGIPVVTDGRDAYMHDKFVVIDGEQVWTGSWNLTENGTYRNNNNLVIIHSAKLAKNYATEFEELFRGEFGASSPDDTPYPRVEIGDIVVENYFSPEGDLPAPILDVLERAESSIYFMAFAFTDNEIAKAMVAKHRAGLTVQGVVESRNAAGSGSDFADLRKAGVDVRKDGNPYVMHHKVIIVDEAIVITGSYNFTSSAARKNDENVLIIHSPEIAAGYLEEFHRVYAQAEP